MAPIKPTSNDALARLEAVMASWTPEECAYHNERFRELCRQFAQHIRFQRNAESVWDEWLATTRIPPLQSDDTPAP
jgi:hypothetical protein